MIESLIIFAIFATAVWYLISKFYKSFTRKEGCDKGCSKCSVAEIEKLANMYQEKTENI